VDKHKQGRMMKYNISITSTTEDGSAFVEGTITEVDKIPEEERSALIFGYMQDLLKKLENDV